MRTEERIEMIQEARRMIAEAQGLVDAAVDQTTQQSNYEAYGKYGFDQLLNNGNPYDDGLQDLIEIFEDTAE